MFDTAGGTLFPRYFVNSALKNFKTRSNCLINAGTLMLELINAGALQTPELEHFVRCNINLNINKVQKMNEMIVFIAD